MRCESAWILISAALGLALAAPAMAAPDPSPEPVADPSAGDAAACREALAARWSLNEAQAPAELARRLGPANLVEAPWRTPWFRLNGLAYENDLAQYLGFHLLARDEEGVWSIGTVETPFTHGYYFKAPDREYELLGQVTALRLVPEMLRRLRDRQVAVAVHIETPGSLPGDYWVFDGARLQAIRDAGDVTHPYYDLLDRYREHWFPTLRRETGLPERELEHFWALTEARLRHSLLIVKTRQAFIRFGGDAAPLASARDLDLEWGSIAVVMSQADGLLPQEEHTGILVPGHRQLYSTGPSKKSEIGRYFRSPGAHPRIRRFLVPLIGKAIQSRTNVITTRIEAEKLRAKAFEQDGFRPIHERRTILDEPEMICEALTTDFEAATFPLPKDREEGTQAVFRLFAQDRELAARFLRLGP